MDCSCDICKSACTYRPGFFLPEEIKPAAALKGMSEKEFFDKYLVVDYWEPDENGGMKYLLSPATTAATPGEMAPFNPKGQCVFYDGGCTIHAAKPAECKFYDHTTSHEESMVYRKEIVDRWDQSYVAQLLGREPQAPEPTFHDFMGMMFG